MRDKKFEGLNYALQSAYSALTRLDWEISDLTSAIDEVRENELFCVITNLQLDTVEVKEKINQLLHQLIL